MPETPLPAHLDPRGRHRGGGGGAARSLRPVGRVVLALFSTTLLVVAGYAWYQFRDLDKGVSRVPVAVGRNAAGSDDDVDGTDQNILVVGNDERTTMTDREVKELRVGRGSGSLATDTMMIVHVPADGSRASLISLPRDTTVDVPDGYARQKLNGAYASAYADPDKPGRTADERRTDGANLLIKTITNLTGLTIDHYVQIGLLGFYRISKAIGGVKVTMCADVDDRAAANRARGENGGSGLVLSKGTHTISGVKALQFVRQRHGLRGGDFARVRRQQYFLTSAFRRIAGVGVLLQLRELGDALKRSVYFDGSLNLLDLAKQLENLTANNILGKTIPTDKDADGNLSADPATVRPFVADVVAGRDPSAASAPSSTAAPTSSSAAPRPAATKPALDSHCIN